MCDEVNTMYILTLTKNGSIKVTNNILRVPKTKCILSIGRRERNFIEKVCHYKNGDGKCVFIRKVPKKHPGYTLINRAENSIKGVRENALW